MLLCKDNLEVLSELPNNHIDLIYCDVLYNTKRNNLDFEDNLEDPIKFYRLRLQEMKRVLKDTGLIYIHCDYRLVHYLKVEMDRIFGLKNFRNEIIWYFNSSPRKKKSFGVRHHTILRYSKTDNFFFEDSEIRQPYSLTAPRGYEKEKYYHPLGKVMGDVWQINSLGQNDKKERTGYSTQKPLELMYPIINSSSPIGGLVADFFCGSGTFLLAAKYLERDYIGVDINPKAIEVCRRRLE